MHENCESGAWSPASALYTTAAVGAVGIGAAVLSMRKGTKTHRLLGRVWTGAMVTSCVASFAVRDSNGGFSWNHGLSALSLSCIYHVRRTNVAKHKAFMGAAYVGAVGAGVFAVKETRRQMFQSPHPLFMGDEADAMPVNGWRRHCHSRDGMADKAMHEAMGPGAGLPAFGRDCKLKRPELDVTDASASSEDQITDSQSAQDAADGDQSGASA